MYFGSYKFYITNAAAFVPLSNLDFSFQARDNRINPVKKALTEESTQAETDREAGAKTETPSRQKPAEVPS